MGDVGGGCIERLAPWPSAPAVWHHAAAAADGALHEWSCATQGLAAKMARAAHTLSHCVWTTMPIITMCSTQRPTLNPKPEALP